MMIEKMQMENIKSFEPKKGAIKDLYNHTHELMKRLVWSSGKLNFPRVPRSILPCLCFYFLFKGSTDANSSLACRSWFKNGKTHGPVTAIYPGSRLHFFELLKNVRWEDFELTYKTENRFQFMGNGNTQCEMSVDGDPVWYFDDPFTKI